MLESALQGMEAIFTIAIIVYLGFELSRRGWFSKESSDLIVKLVTRVSLPLFMIRGLVHNFTAEHLIAMLPDLKVPVLSILLAMFISWLLVKLLRIRPGRRGLFMVNCFIANTVFIGLPVNAALFGDISIPSVMLYYIANTTFFWTVGVQMIVSDIPGSDAPPFFSVSALKKVMSPPLVGFFVGLALVLLNVQFPPFIDRTMMYIGSMTTPLSLIFVGIELYRVDWKHLQWGADVFGSLVGRFIICPLCVLVLLPILGVGGISAKVFLMQAAMPAMTQIAIITRLYGGDSVFAAMITFTTILGGLISIPLYMTIANVLFQ